VMCFRECVCRRGTSVEAGLDSKGWFPSGWRGICAVLVRFLLVVVKVRELLKAALGMRRDCLRDDC